jgi:outer membrane lipoprotein SlyB
MEMTNFSKSSLALAALTALALGGCAVQPMGSRDYDGYQVRNEQSVRFGVVESVRDVNINLRESGVGTAAGVTLGAIGGSAIGHNSGSAAAAVAGAVIGGIVGQQIERDANKRLGIELTVLLDGGMYIAVTQEADEQFRTGDRVRILSTRGITRVTH